jgi:hypothetical protein
MLRYFSLRSMDSNSPTKRLISLRGKQQRTFKTFAKASWYTLSPS